MCTYNGGTTSTEFNKHEGAYLFKSQDRETFGNETFEITIQDINLYGSYKYSLKV